MTEDDMDKALFQFLNFLRIKYRINKKRDINSFIIKGSLKKEIILREQKNSSKMVEI